MWNRACPLCFVKLSPFTVLSRSNDIVCPACHAELELSRQSRVLSSTVGIIAGLLVFQLPRTQTPLGGWAIPVVAVFLAFGLGSALLLSVRTDLVVRPSQYAVFPQAHQ